MRGVSLHLMTRRVPHRVLSWAGGERGAELVETAMVFPLLMTLLLGIFWMGRAYNIYGTITLAAREGARYAAAPTCATCGGALPSAAAVQAVVDKVLSGDSLNPTKKLNYTFQQNVPLNPGGSPTVTGVVVSFSYPVSLPIPFVSATTINVSTRAQMRQELQ